ncbi:MAG: hypothetical protein LQ338_002167 [Usnochroma carphineum]|nr:MAG: hypothetical protein LQ338_002167 [Usnochroma carphineum]
MAPTPPSSSTTTTSIQISHLPPPNPSILLYPPTTLSSLALTPPSFPPLPPTNSTSPTPSPPLPLLFLSSLSIRIPVFIHEQHCSLAGEIDTDDPRSHHFVAFAFAPQSDDGGYGGHDDGEGEKGTAASTLRLVPPPHSHHDVEVKTDDPQARPLGPQHGKTRIYDGREPYMKIGRMATLRAFRGRGIAAQLLEYALDWATEHRAELSARAEADGEGENGEEWKGLVLSHAQVAVEGWWVKMGFVADEGMGRWWEEGIEHVGMWRRL